MRFEVEGDHWKTRLSDRWKVGCLEVEVKALATGAATSGGAAVNIWSMFSSLLFNFYI